jgi:hypothetical protein
MTMKTRGAHNLRPLLSRRAVTSLQSRPIMPCHASCPPAGSFMTHTYSSAHANAGLTRGPLLCHASALHLPYTVSPDHRTATLSTRLASISRAGSPVSALKILLTSAPLRRMYGRTRAGPAWPATCQLHGQRPCGLRRISLALRGHERPHADGQHVLAQLDDAGAVVGNVHDLRPSKHSARRWNPPRAQRPHPARTPRAGWAAAHAFRQGR